MSTVMTTEKPKTPKNGGDDSSTESDEDQNHYVADHVMDEPVYDNIDAVVKQLKQVFYGANGTNDSTVAPPMNTTRSFGVPNW